jgi:hypothetical protein
MGSFAELVIRMLVVFSVGSILGRSVEAFSLALALAIECDVHMPSVLPME